jgi:CheY-like chemotaxis protein
VEDQPEVRRLAADVLKTHGYRVIEASQGEEALAVVSRWEGPIHLLLTDVVMPIMDGPELADRLKSTRPETRVLFMSGYSENSIARRGLIDSGLAYLPKPFTPAGLTTKVRAVLDGPHKCTNSPSGG